MSARCRCTSITSAAKIEPDPAKPIYLKNVWGKGYIFRPEGETEA